MKEKTVIGKIKFIMLMVSIVLTIIVIGHVCMMIARISGNDFTPQPFNISEEHKYAESLKGILTLLRSEQVIHFKRNIFEKKKRKTQKNNIYVDDIVFEPFVFKYMGYIEKQNGEVIAQINFNNKSYFVKSGNFVDKWIIVSIEKDKVIAMGEEGADIILPIRTKVFSKKPYAVLVDSVKEVSKKVFSGDTFGKYKILDIKKDTVILSSSSGTLTLNK